MNLKWRSKPLGGAGALGAGLALLFAGPAMAAGYEALSSSGAKVLKTCNPTSSASVTACKVTSLPGVDGYDLVGSRSQPIIINGITIGTQYEKVWRACADSKQLIFGVRLQLNASQWDETGVAFNANDVTHATRTDKSVDVAYFVGSPAATKLLQYAGRAYAGLNEYTGSNPPRNNGYVDFRVDANAAERSGPSSPNSPWLLLKTTAPEGYSIQDFAVRILNSENTAVDQNSIYTSGYQSVCTTDSCAPDDDED